MIPRDPGASVRRFGSARLLGAVTVLLVLFVSFPAGAQPNQERTVSGIVTDRHREPLAGAVVQVHSETTLSVVSYITDRSGRYIFKHLSANDDYDIFATYRGVRSNSRRLGRFDSKQNREFRLVIKKL